MASSPKNNEAAAPLLRPETISVPPPSMDGREIAVGSDECTGESKRGLGLLPIFRAVAGSLGISTFAVTVCEARKLRWSYYPKNTYIPLAVFALLTSIWQCLTVVVLSSQKTPKVVLGIGETTFHLCGGGSDGEDVEDIRQKFRKNRRRDIALAVVDSAFFFGILGSVAGMFVDEVAGDVAAMGISLMVFQLVLPIFQTVPALRRLAIMSRDEEYEYQIRLRTP